MATLKIRNELGVFIEIPALKGNDGKSFTILGVYPTLLDLQTAHPTGTVGDYWAVGDETMSDLYIWDSVTSSWKDVGQIGLNMNADTVVIDDLGSFYIATEVEGALQEVGSVVNELIGSEAYFGFDSNQQMVTLNFQDGTSLNLGSELWYAQGKAVGSIANGDNVMLAGSQGDHYLVKKAVASELAANPQLYLGVATKGSANNEWVKVTRWGLVNDVNTNGWTYGTKLYFDPTTLGFTNVLPSLPNARIEVGMVVKQHSKAGIILVLPYALNLYTNSEIDTMINSTIVDTSLASASWVGSSAPYTYSLTVSGVTTTSNQELLPSTSITSTELLALQEANIIDAGQSANTISLKAFGTKPTVDIPIRVILRGKK